jgi:hypothetical protein
VLTPARWTEIRIPLSDMPVGRRFACELQIVAANPDSAEFDDHVVRVRNLEFVRGRADSVALGVSRTVSGIVDTLLQRSGSLAAGQIARLRGVYRHFSPRPPG